MKQKIQAEAISQELSSLEEQMRYANDLKAKIAEATLDLKKSYLGLISAKDEFYLIKKENIEEIRSYKFAVASEAQQIESAIKKMSSAVSHERVNQLKEFVEICERMQALRANGFFAAVSIAA